MVPLVGFPKVPVGSQEVRSLVPRAWTSVTGSVMTVCYSMTRSTSSLPW